MNDLKEFLKNSAITHKNASSSMGTSQQQIMGIFRFLIAYHYQDEMTREATKKMLYSPFPSHEFSATGFLESSKRKINHSMFVCLYTLT